MIDFKWTSAIQIGHPEIDQQHQQLFLLGAAVVDSHKCTGAHKHAASQLQVFIAYAFEHFKYEEGLMRSAGYPLVDRHVKYHASLLSEIMVYCNKVHWGENPNPEGFTKFLWNWLNLHIDISDRELAAWLKSQEHDPMNAPSGVLC